MGEDPLTDGFSKHFRSILTRLFPRTLVGKVSFITAGSWYFCVTTKKVRGKYLAFALEMKKGRIPDKFDRLVRFVDRRAAEAQVIRWHKEMEMHSCSSN